uniref:Class III homeodomain-leucine zipper protein n=1 Tax=Cyrtomium guizhouense TaxID=306076 RepID=A0A2S1CVK9_9MONI|nr:class III homeodomain-leucine zipper protein [Cyrtomium guizhouense]
MGSSKGKDGKLATDSGKYARYTTEQVELLESIYNDCPKPSSARRQQIIRECPLLANIGQKQLKVWFQNRRCREKQRKETSRLQSWASKLNAMHQLLLEENDRLQKQAAHLSSENQYLRQQLHLQHPQVDLNYRVAITSTHDTSSESVVTNGQHQRSPQHTGQGWNVSQLSAVAEMTLADFIAKATGGMVNGIPLPGMKPGPDSIGAVALPRTRGGVAAQACDLVDLGAFKVADIIKNRISWLEDCRKQVVIAAFTAERGGLVEIIHTQMYAPTMSAAARDFWTLRYTCLLENENLVVCEASLAGGQGMPEVPSLPGFIRAEMLPSGVLIRPCEQGGSVVMVLDDMNFLPGGLSEGLCPLYETSIILAWRVTYKVLCHLRGLAGESTEAGLASNQVSSVQGFRHRLVRGFNDAINCFPDDGWVALVNDGPSTVSVHINPSYNFKQFGVKEERTASKGGLICAKASLPLHKVSSSLVMHLLREHWTTWADVDGDASPIDLSRASVHDNVPKQKFSTVKVFQPVSGQNEALEVVRLQKLQEPGTDITYQADSFLLQLCSGMKDTTASTHAHLIFAHIDASVPDDAPLVPSGFRVMHLDTSTENLISSQTLDLASSLEDRSATFRMQNHLNEFSSALTIAFQYTYEIQSRDAVALKAQRNVQAIFDFLQQAMVSLRPPPSLPVAGSQCRMEMLLLVQNLTDSYRIHTGQELLPCADGSAEGLFQLFWNFQPAVVCCAWKPLPEFIFANNSAVEMFETSLPALREMSLERMFNDGCRKTDYSQPPSFLKEGFAHLPAGVCLTSSGRHVSYEHATGWKVITVDQSVQIAAFLFVNWCVR